MPIETQGTFDSLIQSMSFSVTIQLSEETLCEKGLLMNESCRQIQSGISCC